MARIPTINVDDFPEEARSLLQSSMQANDIDEAYRHLLSTSERSVHKTIANNPEILETFRESLSTFWNESGLTAREREYAILTVAYHVDSEYEWHQHVRHALSVGITPAEIRSVADGETDQLSSREGALVDYVAAFATGSVDDGVHGALAQYVEPATIVGVAMLSGFYLGFAHTLDALDVETEEPFVGWDLEGIPET